MPGALYLIGTPIGNLGDLSPRALETLRSLNVLYCEDTRVTIKLLTHFGLQLPLRALSDDSPASHWDAAVAEALGGQRIGFAADAGMPGVSDPGRKLVRAAWAAGIAPMVIPGPSSVGTLLAACPFVERGFRFLGFPPRKPGERAEFVREIVQSPEPCFLFEAPHRVRDLLGQLCANLEPARRIIYGREMTKLFEEFRLFAAEEWEDVAPGVKEIGEYSIAVEGRPEVKEALEHKKALQALERLAQAGFSRRDAVRALAAAWDVPANEVKKLGYGGEE